jgi:hypothetical protein
MATNKPAGDNARKGAVKKRSQLATKTMGKKTFTKPQQERRSIHGAEEEDQVQRRAQRAIIRLIADTSAAAMQPIATAPRWQNRLVILMGRGNTDPEICITWASWI